MGRPLSVLLVQNELEPCHSVLARAGKLKEISFAGITNVGETAAKLIKDHHPDAIVLDLELEKSIFDGLTVLKEMLELHFVIKPYVLVTTYYSNPIVFDKARALGADYIMKKHKNDYSLEKAIDFLQVMRPHILSHVSAVGPSSYEKYIETHIHVELDHVGIRARAKGYQYLTRAIRLKMDRPFDDICTIVALEFGKTKDEIERAMQRAIDWAWKTADIDDLLNNYAGPITWDRGTPTPLEFIHYYSEKLKN